MPDITETLYVTDAKKWRAWLEKNFEKKSEIWLLYPRKSTGKQGVSYNDAVEQALCFGWIDSIQKSFDEVFSAQRYTPRKNFSYYSQPNIERLRYMYETDQLMPHIKEMIEPMLGMDFVFPKDIMKVLEKNSAALAFYETCSPSYQRIRIAYIFDARDRPMEYKKRLANFIKSCEQGKKIMGHGGVEKYY